MIVHHTQMVPTAQSKDRIGSLQGISQRENDLLHPWQDNERNTYISLPNYNRFEFAKLFQRLSFPVFNIPLLPAPVWLRSGRKLGESSSW